MTPMTTAASPLFESFGLLPDSFAAQVEERLARRLATTTEYTAEEIERVSQKSPRLCSPTFSLEQQEYEKLRVLCILSQCAVPSALQIRSHRRFIGKAIVGAKRALWKIISAQLEQTFNGIQEFCAWMLVSHIQSIEKLHQLEEQVQQQSHARNSLSPEN